MQTKLSKFKSFRNQFFQIPSATFSRKSFLYMEPKKFTILHFNDVYEIQEDESPHSNIVGGVARFHTLVHSHSHLNPLIFFSGDLWSPSKLSVLFEGKQVVEGINSLNISAACLGNHDLDFGEQATIDLNAQCNFPWILTNVKSKKTGNTLANVKEYHTIDHAGLKFGILGIAEQEWIGTLSHFDAEDLIYEEYDQCVSRWAETLRNDHACDFIIALTHMRTPQDQNLAHLSDDLDLILGGHDHAYFHQKCNENLIVKSGQDYQSLSVITVTVNGNPQKNETLEIPEGPQEAITDENVVSDKIYFYSTKKGKYTITVQKKDTTAKVERNARLHEITLGYCQKLEDLKKMVLYKVTNNFDVSEKNIKFRSTTFGNFVCDLLRIEMCVHVVIYNAGGFRGGKYYDQGKVFTLGDLYGIFPFVTPICKIQVKGCQMLELLENSVSKWGSFSGRYAQLAGIRFKFDMEKPSGSRVVHETVEIRSRHSNWAVLDPKKVYTVATTEYLATGKDGYETFTNCPQLIDGENGPDLVKILKDFFLIPLDPEHRKEFSTLDVD
jgi:5'-nucleotidase